MQDTILNITHKIQATNEQLDVMLAYYKAYLQYNASNYIIARAKLPRATITFYKTNTVLFQGQKATFEYNIWAEKFNLELAVENEGLPEEISTISAIGSDEVGTGDYFGPIVVCACFVPSNKIEELKHLGVKDSKLLTDKQMIPLGLKIAETIPYSIVQLEPSKINKLHGIHTNLNYLKAYLHNKAINSILKKCEKVKYDAILVDEFTPKEKYLEYLKDQDNVNDSFTMVPKGESVHIAIAAASVLARTAFLRELHKLSNLYEIDLLKGAGKEVDRTAIQLVKNFGYDSLFEVAKVKFANTERVKAYFNENPLPKSKQNNVNNI